MKTKPSKDFFWVSYGDLMTSLFFVVFALFAVLYVQYKENDPDLLKEQIALLRAENSRLQKQLEELRGTLAATQAQLKKIDEINTAVRELETTGYFVFNEEYKRFSLKDPVNFETMESKIPESDKPRLNEIGGAIQNIINELKADPNKKGIKYMIVIEGMASKDSYDRNYELSYERALSLYRLWKNSGITFDPSVCEIQIAGSGTEAVDKDLVDEKKNQRFVIQIVPKVADMSMSPQ